MKFKLQPGDNLIVYHTRKTNFDTGKDVYTVITEKTYAILTSLASETRTEKHHNELYS